MDDQEKRRRLEDARMVEVGLTPTEKYAVRRVAEGHVVSDSMQEVAAQGQAKLDAEEASEIWRVFGC